MRSSTSGSSSYEEILRQAKHAVRQGDKPEARRLSRLASRLDPEKEEPWLLLSGLSEPRPGLAYAARALEINPGSKSAKKAIRWHVRRLPRKERKEALREAHIPEDFIPKIIPLDTLAQSKLLSTRVVISAGIIVIGLGIWVGGNPADALQPQAATDPLSKGWIDVDLSEQRVRAYEGTELVRTFVVSTGTAAHPTLTGQYRVYIKLTSTAMAGPGYYLPGVPYTMYYYRGYALHGTYWHNNFGVPMSHGCINLMTPEAEWLFNFSSLGTLVNVHL
jgi:lipoprotein-anchoring transpeptidase ErfK/SrfK